MFVCAELVCTQYATTLSNGARAYWLRTVPVAELALDLIVNVCAVSWLMNTYSEILLLSTAVDDPALLLKACVEQAKILRSTSADNAVATTHAGHRLLVSQVVEDISSDAVAVILRHPELAVLAPTATIVLVAPRRRPSAVSALVCAYVFSNFFSLT